MSAARGRCQPNRCAATAALSGHSHQHQGGGGQQITVGVGTGPVVRIGAVRVRLSPAPVAQPGGDCCCIPRSRIPLPATTTSVATATAANNRRGIFSRGAGPAPVYRSTLEWRQRAPNVVTGCFGRDKTSGGSEEDARQLIETDTLDRLLKSRFGGDRGGRGKRPAPHKKKPRSSDKTERLRELTEKLKSPPGRAEAGPSTGARVSGGGQPEPAPKPKSPAVQPQPPPPTATDDDFETNLKLPKAESRTIVGSYIQRTIPFRSASFSQVDFSPSDGKYIRIGRTPSTSKIPSLGNSSMCLSLPRKKNADSSPSSASVASSTTVIDASGSSNPSINSAPGSSEWVFPKGNSKAVEAHVKSPSLRSLTHPLGRRSTSEEANSFSTVEGTGLWTVGSGERQLEGLREESDTDVMSTGPDLTETDNQNQGNSLSPEKEAGCVESSQTSGQQGQSPLLILGKNIDSINNNVESVVENVTNLCVSDDIGEYKLGIDSDTIGSQELENSSHLDNPNLTQPLPTPPVQTFVTKWPEETVTSGECQSGVSDLIDPKEVVLRSHSGSDEGKDEHKINKVQSQKCRGGVMKSFIECTVIPPNMSEEDMRKRWSDDVNSGDRTSNEWGSSAQEEPQSPEDGGIRLNWPRVIDRPDKKWLERPRLVCQSSEEKDDDSMRGSPRRFHPLGRNDSLSEGESDPGRPMTPTRDGTASPSILGPSDQSDSESRFGSSMSLSRSPNTTRRYSKRPLRGPYGQMLEAEMKKPEANRKFSKLPNEDLKFLENYTQPPTSPVKPARTRAVDDCHLRRSFTSPEAPLLSSIPRSSPKRKVSANIPFSAPNPLTLADDLPPIAHIRTTSSPSQLEGCATAAVTRTSANSRPPPPQPSPQLLAQLLKGSSERALGQDTHSLPLHHWKPPSAPAEQTQDTRTHVVAELYETERSYVESLQTLVTKYLEPLKSPDNAGLVEAALVDEIFYQVPAILTYHEEFLEALKNRIYNWNVKQGVGDIFLETFSKQAVIDTYAAFINNWKTAKEAIKTTCQAKPAFARFLEAMAREHKGKLALDSLLIMPVQRIPRYELLIQTLLKHTETSHPDHGPLCAAQREVHALAVRINCTERDSLELEQLEGLIEGAHLVAAERSFLRHDLVTVASGQGRKERALFLFSDLLVVTSIKRRSGTIRKPSMNCPGTIASTLEANKYKMLMRIPLDDLEIVKEKDENVRRMLREMEHLREDVCALAQMSELAGSLHCPHSQLEADVREMHAALSKQLAERQASDSQLSYLELMLNTQNGVDNLSVIFSKPDKRSSWEEALIEAKQRLALSADKRLCPELVTPVPIRKTRAGLQLTCAAPTLGAHDVWVCNSDGYVGQVCVLSLTPEPTVSSCNGVCNARILCIAAVPGFSQPQGERHKFSLESNISISVEDTEKSISGLESSSSSSSSEEEGDVEGIGSVGGGVGGVVGEDCDHLQPTMWLGTEDGCIHVYNSSDNIRIKKNKVKIQHGSAVHAIIYLDNRVFVSLANGDVTVYNRDSNGVWNTSQPSTVSVGTAASPVSHMVPIAGKLWCTCHATVRVLNINSLCVEHQFNGGGESQRSISCLAVAGLGVWLSMQHSAVIRLYHATSYDSLAEVNIAPSVTKMLASCDDIIRQHKAACLRVTALLACQDLLWVGTSAGVILTMPLPHVTPNTAKLSSALQVTGVPHGHTGHVRFLTAVEGRPLRGERCSTKQSSSGVRVLVISGGDGYEDFRSASISEVAGREDSTNHLLLWQT